MMQNPSAWQSRAACTSMSSTMFFPPDDEPARVRAGRIAQAKVVCLTCSVLTQCRSYALAADERYGVWGGLSEQERAWRRYAGSVVPDR